MSIYAFHSQNKPSSGAEFDITLEFKHDLDNLTTIDNLPFKPTIGLLALCCNINNPGFIKDGNPTITDENKCFTLVFNQFIESGGDDCFLSVEPGTTVLKRQLRWAEVAKSFKDMFTFRDIPVFYDFSDWDTMFTDDFSKVTRFAMTLRPFIICHQSNAYYSGSEEKRGICTKDNPNKYVYFFYGTFKTKYKYSNYEISRSYHSPSTGLKLSLIEMRNTDYGLMDFYGNLVRAMDIFNKDQGYDRGAYGVRSYLDYLYMGSIVGGFDNKELFPTFEIDLNQCKNWDDLDLRLKWDFSIDLKAIIQSSRS